MSQRLYILFKFPDENYNFGKIAERINVKHAGMAEVRDGIIDLHGPWPGYIDEAYNLGLNSFSPLYCFFFWSYWNDVLDN